MRVLFVGLGSIGKRHLNNLIHIAARRGISLEVDALRSSLKPLPAELAAIIKHQYIDFEQLGYYDIAFITNPTNMHAGTLAELSGKVENLFIEKPIFDHTKYNLADFVLDTQKAYVAAPMRWCGVFLALKKLMPTLRPYSARVICSSYLPEWRPGVDYRKVYSAHKEMGGGVTIDLIHEWDYMVELFGKPLETYNFKGTYSDLEIDSDDLSVYIARYPHMLAEVHLDYFGRTYRRAIELFCEDGTVTADFGEGTLTLANGVVQHYEEPVNDRYMREMEYFLDYAMNEQGESINSPAMALDVLKLTLGEE